MFDFSSVGRVSDSVIRHFAQIVGLRLSPNPTRDLNLNEEEYTMFTLDAPDMPTHSPNIVMIAQNNQAKQVAKTHDRIYGICQIIDNSRSINATGEINIGQTRLSPSLDAEYYLHDYAPDLLNTLGGNIELIKTTVLKQPEHGVLKDAGLNLLPGTYRYEPNASYFGKDTVSVLVEAKGVKVKISYYFYMDEQPAAPGGDYQCAKTGYRWKISTAPNTDPTIIGLDSTIANLADGAYFLSLPHVFAGSDYISPTITFTSLPGTAGHGWSSIIHRT